MLRQVVAMVHHAGLTVSLDHISFEDVIRDADVSRSAAYRRWPYKDLFFGDLIEELAKEGAPPGTVDAEYALIQHVVAGFPGELDTPGQRHELLTELFRRLALLDFQALADSMEWQTYVALQAALDSITDSERRDTWGGPSRIRAAAPGPRCGGLGAARRPVRLPDPAGDRRHLPDADHAGRRRPARARHHGTAGPGDRRVPGQRQPVRRDDRAGVVAARPGRRQHREPRCSNPTPRSSGTTSGSRASARC